MGLARESSLTTLLDPLREKGFVDIAGGIRGRQRRIELTPSGRALTGMGLPILGAIPAGPLQEAVQQTDEWLSNPGELLRTQPGDFLLRVQGDSMLGAGILPGDLVLLRPAVQWRSGEIAAVQLADDASGIMEATLKYLDLLADSRHVRLRAANPLYPDREVPAEAVSVAGVYRGLVRNL
jgi:repressor LexA